VSDKERQKPPTYYWVISAVLFIWGAAYAWLALFSFALATPDDWANMIANDRILPEYADYIARIPAWVVAITAIAAFTRLFGALCLLFRRSWAVLLYSISLACVVVIMFRGFVFADVASVIRDSQIGVEALFMALSIFAVWFSRKARSENVLL